MGIAAGYFRAHTEALRCLWDAYRGVSSLHEAFREEASIQKKLLKPLWIFTSVFPYLLLVVVCLRAFLFWSVGLRPLDGYEADFIFVFYGGMTGVTIGMVEGLVAGLVGGVAGGFEVGATIGLAAGIVGSIGYGTTSALDNGPYEGVAIGLVLGSCLAVGLGIVRGIAEGVAEGVVIGVSIGLAIGTAGTIAYGITVGITFALVLSIAGGLAFGLAGGLSLSVIGGVSYAVVVGVVLGVSVGVAESPMQGGIIGGCAAASIGIIAPRIHYLALVPLSVFGVIPHRYHPVFWDKTLLYPFPGLDTFLIRYAEKHRDAARKEIDYILTSYPSQRSGALRARVILLARDSAEYTDLCLLGAVAGQLKSDDRIFNVNAHHMANLLQEISDRGHQLNVHSRPIFQLKEAEHLYTQIEKFEIEAKNWGAPLSGEWVKAAQVWRRAVDQKRISLRQVVDRQPMAEVFRAGDPVNRNLEAFIPRESINETLTQQLLIARGCPGILISGPRRVGKTTVLKNLTGYLPSSASSVYFTMESARLSQSESAFRQRVAFQLGETDKYTAGSWAAFEDALDRINSRLENQNRRVIVAIDEYEEMNEKIVNGEFDIQILKSLRNSIQEHRHIVWLFAGNKGFEELEGVPWAEYLISIRTMTIGMFTPEESLRLLSDPLGHAPRVDEHRPRFSHATWGPGGALEIHRQAGGWPHLVQLLAETALTLLTDSSCQELNDELFGRMLVEAGRRGEQVLRQLVKEESSHEEWQWLLKFRMSDAVLPPDDIELRRALKRRQIIQETEGWWSMRVPMMQRWLKNYA